MTGPDVRPTRDGPVRVGRTRPGQEQAVEGSPVQEHARVGGRAALALAALVLVAVPFGVLLLLVQQHWGPLVDLDDAVRDGLHRLALHSPALVRGLLVVSALGTTGAYLVVVLGVAALLVHRGRPRSAGFAVVTVAGSAVLNAVVKGLVDRARPVLPDPVAHASYASFPSGHAQSSVVTTGVLLVVLWPGLRGGVRAAAVGAAVLWVLLVGFARVGLGVHYLSDVLAGWVLGAAWLAALVAAVDPRRGAVTAR